MRLPQYPFGTVLNDVYFMSASESRRGCRVLGDGDAEEGAASAISPFPVPLTRLLQHNQHLPAGEHRAAYSAWLCRPAGAPGEGGGGGT